MISSYVAILKGDYKQTSNMIRYLLLLSMFVSMIGSSWSQAISRDIVPDFIWIFQSNQYDNSIEYLQDPQCSVAGNSTQNGTLLKCAGNSSTLFDGIIGTQISQDEDLLQYYTWQQAVTPRPYVAMSFDPPLEEIHNITLYFYRQIIIRVPFISVCISRSPDHAPCEKTEFEERSELHSTMDVRLMKLLTNVISVTYLRIDLQYDRDDEGVFIFLSEIRVESIYTEIVITSTMDNNTNINSSNVPSSDNDDDSVSVAVISGAVVGTLLLIIIIAIVTVIVVIILCNRRRKKSRRTHNIDHKVKQSLNPPNSQQHTHDTSDQSQYDYTNSGTLQFGAEIEPKSKRETINRLYTPVDIDSLLRRHDTSRSDVIGCDVIITPNPSYVVGPNSSETGKECEYQYDYVQTDDGSVQHDKVVGATTSGGDEVINPADNVIIDPNPSYTLPQDVKLEDNPSYTQLLAS